MSTPCAAAVVCDPIAVAAPTFLVGHDPDGHWLAVETHGMGGGIFVSREAALGYARAESCHRPGGVVLASTPITLR